jgi:hypothetical protein
MTAATADAFLGIHPVRSPSGGPWPPKARATPLVQVAEQVRYLSDSLPGILAGPSTIPASWLGSVERRIRDSIGPTNWSGESDGRYIGFEIGKRAVQFFRETSDLWASEPYLYSSKAGDLVAEIKDAQISITAVIGGASAIVFAVAGDEIFREEICFDEAVSGSLRGKMKDMVGKSSTDQHVAVDAK